TKPQGAFYIYADCRRFLNEQIPDSMALSQYLLDKAGVAITPGNDFGEHLSQQYCRFAFTVSLQTESLNFEKLSLFRESNE
ncbi:MAG: hypothetical protein RQ982_13000, partial [Gammaproteobacteria bacterium]|nr:hypothetical protein [Gammaproteobacteria bacterium]